MLIFGQGCIFVRMCKVLGCGVVVVVVCAGGESAQAAATQEFG